jgi:hypothetical protein
MNFTVLISLHNKLLKEVKEIEIRLETCRDKIKSIDLIADMLKKQKAKK